MEKVTVTAASTPAVNPASTAMILDIMGYSINLMSVMIVLLMLGVFFLFWRIQTTQKLDFADMITKDGRAVSLTKVLQLIGGMTATWIMIKMTLTGTLTETVLGIYLAYVGGIEGYSKFVAAKYKYNEGSVRDAVGADGLPIRGRYSRSDPYASPYASDGAYDPYSNNYGYGGNTRYRGQADRTMSPPIDDEDDGAGVKPQE